MKILFLTRRIYPEIGGVEKHVLEISKRLQAMGHEVKIVAELSSKSYGNRKINYHSSSKSDRQRVNSKQPVKSIYSDHVIYEGIEIIYINPGTDDWFKKFRIWAALLEHVSLVREADVVHCHDVFFWYLPFRFLFPFKKIYTTFHGYESYPLKKKNVLVRKLSEILSLGNICVGDFMKKWYGTKPTFITYGAVDGVRGSVSLPRANVLSALFYGRLDEQTNVIEYKKAVEIIKKSYPKFRLDIIGDGKYKNMLSDYIRSGFIDNPERKLSNYRFAFSSRYLSILEAAVAKRLIFAVYDNPIKKDYLDMAPFSKWIVMAGSAEELAEKVIYHIRKPRQEQKKVDLAYDWAQKQTWDRMVRTYLKLWSL